MTDEVKIRTTDKIAYYIISKYLRQLSNIHRLRIKSDDSRKISILTALKMMISPIYDRFVLIPLIFILTLLFNVIVSIVDILTYMLTLFVVPIYYLFFKYRRDQFNQIFLGEAIKRKFIAEKINYSSEVRVKNRTVILTFTIEGIEPLWKRLFAKGVLSLIQPEQ